MKQKSHGKASADDFLPPAGAGWREQDASDRRLTDLPEDDLGRESAILRHLHPELIRFRDEDLTAMDDATRRALLADMRQALGIGMLKNPSA